MAKKKNRDLVAEQGVVTEWYKITEEPYDNNKVIKL